MSIHERFKKDVTFPVSEVESCIRDMLAAQARAEALLRPRVPSASEPEVDSLVVVEIICAIEEVLGLSLPATFAPRGGYSSAEACVTDLIQVTESVWVELVKKEEYND